MNASMYVVGWVLVHFVWQGAAIAIAAALVLHACRRRSASTRYAIACGALTAMLMSAAVTASLIDSPAAGRATSRVSVYARVITNGDVLLPIDVNRGPASPQLSNAHRIEQLLPWIVPAWLFGVIVLLARTAAGWWRVRRLHRRALSSMRSSWQHLGNRVASRLRLARMVRFVELPDVDVPLVIGCLRPIVVLPIAAMTQLNAAQVEAILAHELAHVRRHDYLVNLMQTLAETLLFYHPAVWWLSGRIRDEREHCCDDVAVAVCGEPVGYAAALAELEVWRGGELNLAAAATGGSLLNRVRRILRVEVLEDSRTSPWTIVLVVAVAMSALTLTIVAQTPSLEPNPKFEVASVRPNPSGDNKMSSQILPGGRYTAINIPPRLLIINSYRLQPQQLVGAPDWISAERFDIVAKAAEEFSPPVSSDGPSQLQLMIRALLEERFKLEVHRQPKEVDIYTLVIARADGKLGAQLKPSTIDCEAVRAARRKGGAPPEPPKPGERPQCSARVGFGELAAGGQPLLELVSMLSGTVGRSVVDRTGLTGTYDMYLKWTPDQLPPRPSGMPADQPLRVNGVDIDPNGPSIFTALQEQLGLKLESARGTIDALVIDHIERPTPD
jgi:uncharacterized protein (TIGR03435 family)